MKLQDTERRIMVNLEPVREFIAKVGNLIKD